MGGEEARTDISGCEPEQPRRSPAAKEAGGGEPVGLTAREGAAAIGWAFTHLELAAGALGLALLPLVSLVAAAAASTKEGIRHPTFFVQWRCSRWRSALPG